LTAAAIEPYNPLHPHLLRSQSSCYGRRRLDLTSLLPGAALINPAA
jgi:hypothetical protein